MDSVLSKIAEAPDGPIHSLVWMAKDANIDLPPIPTQYIETLREVVPLCCYATDERLVQLTNQQVLSDYLVSGQWPVTGMALRLVPKGRWLYWQYILVGRVNLIQVNLRFLLTDDLDSTRLALVSIANNRLQSFLDNEIVLGRYLAEGPRDRDETAHIILCTNETASRFTETHYTWSETKGLSRGRSDAQVLATSQTASSEKEMLLRL